MKGRCEWCERDSDDLVERQVVDDHSRSMWWCRDAAACQAARKMVRNRPRRCIPR